MFGVFSKENKYRRFVVLYLFICVYLTIRLDFVDDFIILVLAYSWLRFYDFMNKIKEEAVDEAYKKGYESGKESANSELRRSAYNDGFDAGYRSCARTNDIELEPGTTYGYY